MAITVTVEDGTGKADANSYISVEAASAYHAANFHTAAAWAALTADQKAQAVITASRMLDQQFTWNGKRTVAAQAMQWPRSYVPNPVAGQPEEDDYIEEDEVPPEIINACAQLAYEVTQANREAAPAGEGLSSFTLEGVMSVDFDLSTAPPYFPDWVIPALAQFGTRRSVGSCTAKLIRA